MATDGAHHSGYDPATIEAVLGEAAHLLRHLGFAAEHAVLIGGVVPSLLILDPPGQTHLGTGDIDLCLSLAIVEGDTAEYERIQTALIAAGYEPTDLSFRWRQKGHLGLEVEFFCPAGEGRPSGTMFRPKAAENPTAKHNFGSKLTAIALDAGEAIGVDAITIEREVTLPGEEGRTRFSFKVCGLLGFLVAKTAALTGRDKPKDAYDIVWLIESWPDGAAAAAEAIRASAAFGRPDAGLMLERLFDEFSEIDRLGPSSFVRFMADPGSSNDERTRLARRAVGAVQELRAFLT